MWKAAAVAVMLGVPALPAGAATMQAVFSGVVAGAWDEIGLFGPAGGTLDGVGYTVTILFDPDLGSRDHQASYDQVWGGGAWGTGSPVLSARLTVGGIAQDITGSYQGGLSAFDYAAAGIAPSGGSANAFAGDYDVDPVTGAYDFAFITLGVEDLAATGPFDLDHRLALASAGGATAGGGYFHFSHYDGSEDFSTNTFGMFVPGSVRIGPAPVPLPASALLLAGGLCGVALVRRRRRAA